MSRLKSLFLWIRNILLCLLTIALGEWLPLMPAFQRFQETHPSINQVLTSVTLVMTILGTLLLAFTQFLVRVPHAHPTPLAGRVERSGKFFSGKSFSAGFSDEAPIWRVRKALQNGEWRRVPRWRRMTLMMLGAILLFYGLFGLLILISSPGIKFFLFLLVIYASARSIYAFAVDRPNRENIADRD